MESTFKNQVIRMMYQILNCCQKAKNVENGRTDLSEIGMELLRFPTFTGIILSRLKSI